MCHIKKEIIDPIKSDYSYLENLKIRLVLTVDARSFLFLSRFLHGEIVPDAEARSLIRKVKVRR